MIKKEKEKSSKEIFEEEQQLLFDQYFALKNMLVRTRKNTKKYKELQGLVEETEGTIIESNKGLVIKLVRKIIVDGVEFEDLMQEGKKAMYEALLKYDHTKDNKFTSYAYKYIDGSLHNYIRDYSRAIRVQWLANENFKIYFKCLEDFRRKYYKLPLDKELIEFMNSNEDTKYMVSSDKSVRGMWDEKRLERMKMIADQSSLSSIYETFGGENDTELFEVTEDMTIKRPDVIVEENNRTSKIRQKLDEIFEYYNDTIDTKIIMDVLKLRFGVYDPDLKFKIIETIKRIGIEEFGEIKETGLTLEQISQIYGITKESARIYESVGLRQSQILVGNSPTVEIKQGHSFRFLARDLHMEERKSIKVEFVNYDKDIISVDKKNKTIKGLKEGTATLLVRDLNTNRNITYNFKVIPKYKKYKKSKHLERKEA